MACRELVVVVVGWRSEEFLWVEVEVDEKKGAGRGVVFKEGEEAEEEVLSLALLLTLSATR